MKLKVRIEYPENLVIKPVLYELGQKTGVVYSIIRADVDVEKKENSFVEVELRGKKNDLEDALTYLSSEGIGVVIYCFPTFGYIRIPADGFKNKGEKK